MFKLNKMLALLIAVTLLLGACTAPPAAPAVEKTQAVVATEAPKPAETEAPKPTAVPTEVPEPTEAPPDFLALFTDLTASISAKGWNVVGAAALNEELASDKAPFLVDVREPAELEKDGYIKGAAHIPFREFLKNLDKLPGLDEPIVVYCGSGHRGGMGVATLTMLGYTNVRNLGGGLGAWKKAELPTETGTPEAAKAISTPIVENQALFTALDNYISNLPDSFYVTNAAALSEALASDKAPTVVDVRAQSEIDKDGYIEGSLLIPMDKFFSSLDQLPAKDAPIVVTCASGHRGGMAMMALQLLGYTNVQNLGGGLGAWKAAKMPVAGGALDWTAIWTDYTKNLPAGFYTIGAADLNTALADKAPFVLDVREQAEVEKDGFIAGAVHIATKDVLKSLDKLPTLDQPIVVYCGSGHRGGFIMAALQLLGYTDVKNLGGGIGAWKKAELPVEMDLTKLVVPEAGVAPAVDAARLADLTAAVDALPEGFAVMKAADLNTELAGDTALTLIDLRPTEDFDKGHIEGSISMPINTILADLTLLPAEKDAPIVVTCQSGHRGGIMLLALRMMGYTNVRNLGGGVNAWTAAELPLVP